MSRTTRIKEKRSEAWYHVCAKVAGKKGEYVLQGPMCQRRLLGLIRHYGKAYCCSVAAFCVMGNHYHLIVHMDAPREVSVNELHQRALILYPKDVLKEWSKGQWRRFARRIFDLSELMRNVQGTFARWYNDTYERTGRFWGDRFKSTLLEEGQAVLDCMLYVDLNPVRAGIVERPEAYEGSSIFARHIRQDGWLADLQNIVGATSSGCALAEYRAQLYHRGNVPTKAGQAAIPDAVLHAEAARGYAPPGMYRQRLRFFVEGMVVGSERFVLAQLSKVKASGRYLKRRSPIRHLDGLHHSLREQRGNARS